LDKPQRLYEDLSEIYIGLMDSETA
jgi:hypothetical protein